MITKYNELTTNSMVHNGELLKTALKQHHIESVTVSYSGGGDSGDIDKIETLPADVLINLNDIHVKLRIPVNQYIDNQYIYQLEDNQTTLSEALRNFTLIWASQQHGGWENNDGGSGEMTINVSDNTCTLQHNEYFTESCCYEYSL